MLLSIIILILIYTTVLSTLVFYCLTILRCAIKAYKEVKNGNYYN